ncbi:hypothetical protein ISN44_As01g031380 [Arabidopsis suecica]|uniref:Uncharacterized protein n=1 Tax=Arabidopsis suecica TaxID=45249 RepID=A0A8T2HA00_ARASU|nr:hypothetical protein ISN44_As01g031380 [Arabidopsis suecica]
MPPYVKKAHNNSTKPVHIYTTPGSEGWALAYGETKEINDYIGTSDVYSEINIEDAADPKGYRVKYTNPNQTIYLNDIVGESSGVADSEIRLSQPDGSIKYYYSITATIRGGGGLTLEGFEPRGEITKDEVEEDDDEAEEGDGATQSTSKND